VIITVDPLVLDTDRRTVTCRGRSRPLPPQQMQLLTMLMEQAGTVVSYSQVTAVFAQKWGKPENAFVSARSRMSRLRGTLTDIGAPGVIQNVRGSGWGMAPGERHHVYHMDDLRAAAYEKWLSWQSSPIGIGSKVRSPDDHHA
jgi:DNA-binding response OmpR family regulator